MSTCTTSPPAGEMDWPSTPLCINTGEEEGVSGPVGAAGVGGFLTQGHAHMLMEQ